ncbi:surface protease GP63 [Trypanosoma rangeli SC58]|uniref:Leishmanolysin-like peptidase n=1 Tax=Trypanosoma rangeli SC58 TaxID=429131 RepID=A0A061ITD9_TRYRA|nr:surface protease GP63 [Trypanosoma rangeli SC58]
MCCAGGCLAAAQRFALDEMMRRGGRPSETAVVREVPRRGQGAMQAYTVATKEDRSDWKPIRIKVFTEDLKNGTPGSERYCEKRWERRPDFLGHNMPCTADDILSEQKKQLYEKTIIPEAVKLHAERLLVRPMAEGVVMREGPGEPCTYFTIPAGHKTDGVPDADMVIYAAAGPSSSNIPAWAATCLKSSDSRPSVGAMNFNPRHMTDTAWSVRVAAHEMAHALGFTEESIGSKSITSEEGVRGVRRKMVTGENVKARAVAHFNCSSLKGMELENDDDAGVHRKMLHWEERSARDELMAPTVGAGYYTALTLAVFADLGYYRVDWSMAEPMSWGNSTGCDFLTKKCKDTHDLAKTYPHMFCNKTDKTTLHCSSDRRHVGTCTAEIDDFMWSPLGNDACPVVSTHFYDSSFRTIYSRCTDASVINLPGSLTGSGSWCLDVEALQVKNGGGGGDNKIEGVCAEVQCEGGAVKVKHLGADAFVPCPEGGAIEVVSNARVQGRRLKCPKYTEVCTIAANGSSLVIPSVLQDAEGKGRKDKKDGRGEGVPPGGSSRAEVSPGASPHGAVGGDPAVPKAEVGSGPNTVRAAEPHQQKRGPDSAAASAHPAAPKGGDSDTVGATCDVD